MINLLVKGRKGKVLKGSDPKEGKEIWEGLLTKIKTGEMCAST